MEDLILPLNLESRLPLARKSAVSVGVESWRPYSLMHIDCHPSTFALSIRFDQERYASYHSKMNTRDVTHILGLGESRQACVRAARAWVRVCGTWRWQPVLPWPVRCPASHVFRGQRVPVQGPPATGMMKLWKLFTFSNIFRQFFIIGCSYFR